MTLDIKNGDYLVISSTEYLIRASEKWPLAGWGPIGFSNLVMVSGSTRRYAPDGTTGKMSTTTPEASLTVTQLSPVNPETIERFPEIASPHTVKETYLYDSDDLWRLIVQVGE